MSQDIKETYQLLADRYLSTANQKKRQIRLISFARFFSFIAIIPAYFYIRPFDATIAALSSFLLLALFLLLVKKFISTEKEQAFYLRLYEINSNEISALQRDYSRFDPGKEFIDPHHDYSFDLDLYGDGSLFQLLNRTVTASGKRRLSAILNLSQRTADDIAIRQESIEELAKELYWRQYFLAKGKESENKKEQLRIDESINQKIELKSVTFLKYLLWILPFITVALIVLEVSGILSGSFYLLPVFLQWVLFITYSKTISKFKEQFENQSKVLDRYTEMLRHIENKSFQSAGLKQLRAHLQHENETAGQIIRKLQKILNEFDFRQNILIGFILNSVFLWDIRCIYRLYFWQKKYAADLPGWFDVIEETDALVSLANCNYNHLAWVIPEVSSSEFAFNAEDLGHPLIDETRCVSNSFQISNEEKIVIITGANMAGKSTFLRTVGVNLILASIGCKVCARSFNFSPIRIYTNMRTSDNLMNDESYFYAELLRLQSMLTLLRNGENLFVILDEMLKGTNSVDKLNGSKELIHQLISLKTHGIVATHDLGLTELAQTIPAIKNQCFEVLLHDDELRFDYKLTNGVTRTMNATFLMKKMGIIPKD